MTHIIRFHSGGKKIITDEQADVIMLESLTEAKGILLDGGMITFGSIAHILTEYEYYKTYPTERPERPVDNFPKLEAPKLSYTKTRYLKAIKGIRKGLNDYINSPAYKNTQAPKELLAKIDESIAKAEGLPEEQFINKELDPVIDSLRQFNLI